MVAAAAAVAHSWVAVEQFSNSNCKIMMMRLFRVIRMVMMMKMVIMEMKEMITIIITFNICRITIMVITMSF